MNLKGLLIILLMKKITIVLLIISAMASNLIMAQQKTVQSSTHGTEVMQTIGPQRLGEFAQEFDHLFNEDIRFGEVWSLNNLMPLRDRRLVTISLSLQGITDSSLTGHLQDAKRSGITCTEAAEISTHIVCHAGSPKHGRLSVLPRM